MAEKADGFCDTCRSFVPSPSRGRDIGGNCMHNPVPFSVKMGDMHWCDQYKKGKQRNITASSSNPEGIVPTATEGKDDLTVNKPQIQELI